MAAEDLVDGLVGGDWPSRRPRARRPRPLRLARAALVLAASWRRLRHVPTLAQLRTLAATGGREPCSYLLDRAVNYLPEPQEMLAGLEEQVGRQGLCFCCRLPGGRLAELVVFPSGHGFDLLGTWDGSAASR